MEDALEAAIRAAGSSQELARLVGVTPQAISQWRRVPAMRVLQVESATGVRREALRPDIYPHDDIAWCGLFVAHTLRAALPDEPLPANPLGARQFLKVGARVSPQLGAIGVFWRGSRDGWLGHVGYLVAATDTALCVRGGNQSDSVSDAWIARDRLLEARWPLTGPQQFNRPLPLKAAGRLSTNEA